MRVLITGSSGQIGTNLALRLLREGHCVFGLDIRPNPWTDKLPTLPHNLGVPASEYSDAELPRDLDVVVHLAAHAKVHELVQQPARALENITMVFNILEFCRKSRVPIVFSSSREVYGDIHRYITEECHADFAFTESPYSASKIAGEALIYSYAQCYDLPYIVFRFSNVYGRFDNDLERMERVIPLFIRKIGRGEPVTVYGKDKMLDFTYVDDCVDGVCRGIDLLVSGRSRSETINLACGQGNTLVTMARLVGEALGVEPEIRVEPTRMGEVTHYVADIAKARNLLGYEPTTQLREGIRKCVAWCTQSWASRTGAGTG